MAPLSERHRRWISLAGAMLLGAVLLLAAWTKAIDPEAFAGQITAEGLDRLIDARWVALVAIALEVGLGAALLLGIRRKWVLLPATALVVFFLFLTGRAYLADLRGLEPATDSCGCFGNLVDRTPAEAFWQDLLLLVPPLAAAFAGVGAPLKLSRWKFGLSVAAAAAGVVLAWRAPELPLDDLATRLRPGVETRELCVGRSADPDYVCLDALIPELDEGEHWVVMTGLDEAGLLENVPRLHDHTLMGAAPRVWLMSDVDPEVLNVFSWQHMLATEVRLVPEGLMRPLHRRLPRSFRVIDGSVVETIAGVPTLSPSEDPTAAR